MRALYLQKAQLVLPNYQKLGWDANASRPKINRMPETPLDQLLAQRKQFLGFLTRRVPDAALAEDILQTAYLRAYEHQDDAGFGESTVAWFYRLLRNAVIDNFRRQETKNKALEAWARELEPIAHPSSELRDEVCTCL